MFCIILSSSTSPQAKQDSSVGLFSLLFLFVVANRGSVDGIVWFLLHDFSFLLNARLPNREQTLTADDEALIGANFFLAIKFIEFLRSFKLLLFAFIIIITKYYYNY